MPRRGGCCESLGVHDLALLSPSSSLFFAQEILYKPIREWILLINLEWRVPTSTSAGLYCRFRPPGAALIDYMVKLLAITLIDMHTSLHLDFCSRQITRCCSFWHLMFFCNQIIALPLNMTPRMFFCVSAHIAAEILCQKCSTSIKRWHFCDISELCLSGVKTLQRLQTDQLETCWNPPIGKKTCIHAKDISWNMFLCDKNLSDSKRSHVKTATNYWEFVKDLMKGGDLLIESCGCILSPKSARMCSALTSAQHSRSTARRSSAAYPKLPYFTLSIGC